jgi:hypothetical protein
MRAGGTRSRRRFVLTSAVAAAVATSLLYLMQRFLFHDAQGWPEILVEFVVIFLLYLGGPSIGPRLRRFFRGPQGE